MTANAQCTSNGESLRSLENLVSEFFHEATGNERKRQIEEIFATFARQEDSWRHCLAFLSETQSDLTMMYCLSVLENIVKPKWVRLTAERTHVRLSVWNFLLTRHRSVPYHIKNKVGKLVVSIAKIDWPHHYSDFMASILDLLNCRETMSLGFMLLQTAIEELTRGSDVCAARRDELTRLMLCQIGPILAAITAVLEGILDKHVNFLTSTPPPSPTQSPNAEEACFGKGKYHSINLLLFNCQ